MKKSVVFLFFLMICLGGILQVQAMSFSENYSMSNHFSWKLFYEPETDDNKNHVEPKPDDKNPEESNSGVSIVDDYCSDENFIKPFIFIGRIFTIIKILIPILIIIFGMIDLFKAVIGSKDDEIKKSIRSLLFRAIAGVVIFFIPTIVHLLFLLIDDWKNYETTYSKCSLCISSPSKCR